jgi:hypothetical protein
MGILDVLFGDRTKGLPPLSPDSEAAQRLEAERRPLESLVEEVNEPVEVVPSDAVLYAFIGRPPKRFGLAWIRDGRVGNFKTLVEERHVAPTRLERLVDQLRDAYQRSDGAPRYRTTVAGNTVVVTVSGDLGREVHELVDQVAA